MTKEEEFCNNCANSEDCPYKNLPFKCSAFNFYMKGYERAVETMCKDKIQYPSIESGLECFAQTYSFNIESKLFPQLSKEQQKLWREEIEQAAIHGGEAGIELSRDIRYKEEIHEISNDDNLENEINKYKNHYIKVKECGFDIDLMDIETVAKHFFQLGLENKQ